MSDLESRPSTPGPSLATFNDTEADSSKKSIFKVPKCPSTSGEQTDQENIALRTRSKVCLTKTPIETIESSFVPPDITTDMYEFDTEVDNEWKEFLTEFMKPLGLRI